MKASAIPVLIGGIGATLAAGAKASDVAQIFANAGARDALLHAAQHVAAGDGSGAYAAELQERVFALPGHGGVGLTLTD